MNKINRIFQKESDKCVQIDDLKFPSQSEFLQGHKYIKSSKN